MSDGEIICRPDGGTCLPEHAVSDCEASASLQIDSKKKKKPSDLS